MAQQNYTQDYSWSLYTPIDNTGVARSLWKSAYKNIRFSIPLQEIITITDSYAANLPGLSFIKYGVVDYWRILLHYNGLVDPIQDVYAGMSFRIPTQAGIVSWLSAQQENQQTTITI